MAWPHQSCRETHQSWMFSRKWSYVFSHSPGMMAVLPERTASSALSAIAFMRRNHCVEIIGSTTPPDRWQRGSVSTWGLVPRARPLSARAFFTARRASLRSRPAKGPALAFMVPSRFRMLISSRPCRLPVAKSLKSCAGVTFTAPVPNFGSTRMASVTMGIVRSTNGWRTRLPWSAVYRGSSGCTATAVSPSIVSGRVVATTISASTPSTGYANSKSSPLAPSSFSTSRSLSAVMHSGHQLMSRVARYMSPWS